MSSKAKDFGVDTMHTTEPEGEFATLQAEKAESKPTNAIYTDEKTEVDGRKIYWMSTAPIDPENNHGF